jgi:hypothetical protein
MARVMPFEWEIWVKEHGHAIGDRSSAYYSELAALPGVRLIDPLSDTMPLIRNAGLVASVAGTACFEAAVMGVPAITFGRIYFAPIMVADHVDPFGLDGAKMRDLLARALQLKINPDQRKKIEDFITWLVAQSYEGFISDPISDPNVLAIKNVEALACATIALMNATVAPSHIAASKVSDSSSTEKRQ